MSPLRLLRSVRWIGFVLSTVAVLSSGLRAQPVADEAVAAVGTVVQVPPEPKPQFQPGLTREQQIQENARWRAEHQAWLRDLTPEQRTELRRRRDERTQEETRKWARQQQLPKSSDGYDWRDAAHGRKLEADVIEQLARDQLAYGAAVKQSFDPYLRGPVFITSDSILNGFHVLFEDSFREMEQRNVFRLRRGLEAVWAQARVLLQKSTFASADTAPALRHAQRVIGPALVLLGAKPELFDPDVRDEIMRQVARIRSADTTGLPEWLGPASTTLVQLDYRRLKPVGFYAANERLADYFRAVRWLQMIPFRAGRETELAAIALLGGTKYDVQDTSDWSFFQQNDPLLGREHGRDLEAAGHELQNFFRAGKDVTWQAQVEQKRRWLLRMHADRDYFSAPVTDDRLPPDLQNRLAEIEYRVVTPCRLPDSALFQELANRQLPPGGLAVATMLGSGFARQHLAEPVVRQIDEAVRGISAKATEGRQRPSLYADYLDVLRSTQLPIAAEAPAVFRSTAWEAKSCQTLLASWAQMRHTFTLQAAVSAMYLGTVTPPPGFVEPNPEFFSRLAGLAEGAKGIFEACGCFSTSPQTKADQLRSDAAFLERAKLDREGRAALDRLSPEAAERHDELLAIVKGRPGYLPGWRRRPPASPASDDEFKAYYRDLIDALRSAADRYETGELSPAGEASVLRERWETMAQQARRLEALAHKQLRRQAWSAEEAGFLRQYGQRLAFVMGYYGNSWLTSIDDAPRWVEVHRDPANEDLLAVGVGRPRIIYVLYPWDGTEILCAGAVMPYYEYTTGDRLTDREWRERLDSAQAPPLPEWMRPYLRPAGLAPDSRH